MTPKEKIVKALENQDFSAVSDMAGHDFGTFRTLISLVYDRENVICWRAIEALGRASGEIAKEKPERVRNLAQRILWMLREESGNNPWSGPDMLGEIVRNSPDAFSDIAPIIASFHDELILRRGVLRAMVRVSDVRPDLVKEASALVEEYIRDPDPYVRACAIQLAANLGLAGSAGEIESLVLDSAAVTLYENGELRRHTVGDVAGEALLKLKERGN